MRVEGHDKEQPSPQNDLESSELVSRPVSPPSVGQEKPKRMGVEDAGGKRINRSLENDNDANRREGSNGVNFHPLLQLSGARINVEGGPRIFTLSS